MPFGGLSSGSITPTMTGSIQAIIDIINIPNRYIGRKFIQELEEFSNKKNLHLYQGLRSMGIDLPYVRKNVKELIGLLDHLIDYAAT